MPVNLLKQRFNSQRVMRSPNDEGMVPTSSLLFRIRLLRFCKFPIRDDIFPVKLKLVNRLSVNLLKKT